jgi:hypothetical protein
MKVSGIVERDPPIFWDDRGIGLLKLVEHEKPIRIKELQRPELPKDLKPGDKITAEINEDDRYYSLISLERERAASPEETGSASSIQNLRPPAEQPPTSEDYNIPYSYKRIGPLYPILVDREGNVIDGKHRLAIDPNWRKEILPWVESRKDLLMARIHANLHRRTVPTEERKKEFTEYADILHADGTAIGELASTLAELTGFGEEYVRQLLPPSLKLKMRSELGKKGKLAQFQLGKTQPETLPDSKVDLDKEAERIGRVFTSAPSQSSAELDSGPCPYCGNLILWDSGRKVFVKPPTS